MKKITKIITSSFIVTIPTIALSKEISHEEINQALSNTNYFDETCSLVVKNNSINEDIPSTCKDYLFIDMRNIDKEHRRSFTRSLTGLGFEEPYILIKDPLNLTNQKIHTYENIITDNIIEDVNRINIDTNGLTRDNGKTPYFTREIHREIPLDNELGGKNLAEIIYKLDFFSDKPFYKQTDQTNYKYVRVTSNSGAGINFYTNGVRDYSSFQNTSPKRMYYRFRSYLDNVEIKTSLSDATLTDYHPRQQDVSSSSFEEMSTNEVSFGFSIPKTPLNISAGLAVSKTIKFESGSYMDYHSHNEKNEFSLTYRNRKYGSHIDEYYCKFFEGNSCWEGATGYNDVPFSQFSNNIDNTPYENGFIPVYTATYRHEPSQIEPVSNLSLNTHIKGLALLGHTRWSIGARYATGPKGSDVPVTSTDQEKFSLNNEYKKDYNVEIDWSSPLFAGAEPVSLKAVYSSDQSAKCITAKDGGELALLNCMSNQTVNINSRSQLFYYTPDNNEYISAIDYKSCLSTQDETLTLQPCDYISNNNQSWSWYNPNNSSNALLYTNSANSDVPFKVIEPVKEGTSTVLKIRKMSTLPTEGRYQFSDIQYTPE
ncbi:TPA: hypothetical protein ACN30S_001060 [Vibrio campbellii]